MSAVGRFGWVGGRGKEVGEGMREGATHFLPTVPGSVIKGVVVLVRYEMPVGIAASVHGCGFTWLRVWCDTGVGGLGRRHVR